MDFIYSETLSNSFLRCDAAADEMVTYTTCTEDCAYYCMMNLKETYGPPPVRKGGFIGNGMSMPMTDRLPPPRVYMKK